MIHYSGTVALTLEQSQHREREGELGQEKRTLKVRTQLVVTPTPHATICTCRLYMYNPLSPPTPHQVELKEMELAHQEAIKELKMVGCCSGSSF